MDYEFQRGRRSGEAKLWDIESGQLLPTLPDYSTWFLDVDFTPDGKRLIFSDAFGMVRFWDIDRRSLETEICGDQRTGSFQRMPRSLLFLVAGAKEKGQKM